MKNVQHFFKFKKLYFALGFAFFFVSCAGGTINFRNNGSSGSDTEIPSESAFLSTSPFGSYSGASVSEGGDHYLSVQTVGSALSATAQTSENGLYESR